MTLTFSPKSGTVHAAAAWRQKKNEVFIDVAFGAPREKKDDKRQGGYALDILAAIEARSRNCLDLFMWSWSSSVSLSSWSTSSMRSSNQSRQTCA